MNHIKSGETSQISRDADYCGKILTGAYSTRLKRHLAERILAFRRFDQIGTPVIPYIAAWREHRKAIWYEFISRYFQRMMGCKPIHVARTFRRCILKQKIYKQQSANQRIIEDIIGPEDLNGFRTDYRRQVNRKGRTEAVYKCALKTGGVVWLKDHAVIETAAEDHIHLSFGCLTIVTKEMEADEARKRMETALRKSEERFRYQAVHDDLTGLYNTRYLYQDLDRLVEIDRSKKRKFSLIFLDIDDFKSVVDAHGHLNASRAIREIGASIQAAIKQPAYGVAYGGDEFVVVLPGFNKKRALDMAEQIRSLMRRTVYLTSRGLNVNLNASYGVATYPDDAEDQTTLIGLADQAMFGVKASGKNRVGDINKM